MTGGAIASTIIIWAIYLGILIWCITRMGKGSTWED